MKQFTKNIFFGLLSVLPLCVVAQSGNSASTTCEVIMNMAPVNRATGYGEEQVIDNNFQAVCQRYNNLGGTIIKVNFRARMNPLATTSNTIRVTIFDENGTTGYPGVILGRVDVPVVSSATLVNVSADLSLGTGVVTISPPANTFIALELFSPAMDSYFVERNNIGDGAGLNLNLIKQAGTWYKDLTQFGPTFDFDFMLLPIKNTTVTANFTSSINAGNVTFTNTSTGSTSYLWDFGDGDTSTATTPPVHNYTADNLYNVKLIARHSDTTCVDSIVHQVNVITGISEHLSQGSSSMILHSSSIAEKDLLVQAPINTTLMVYDMLGSCRGSFPVAKNEVFHMNVSSFNSGIYFIKADNLKPLRFVKK